MSRSLPRFSYALLLALVPACSGGGCSSCSGVTPLPGGFQPAARIENAAAVRVTQGGFDFMEDNLGAIVGSMLGGDGSGILTFDVPQSGGTVLSFIDYTVCPGGADGTQNPKKCQMEIDLANAQLGIQPQGPHEIQIAGLLPVRLAYLPIQSDLGDFDITITGNQACPGDNATFKNVNVDLRISVETDTNQAHTGRYGYTRLKILQVNISQSDIEDGFKACGGFTAAIVDALKGIIVGQLFGGLQDTLVTTVEQQLCQKSNPAVSPSCPIGSNDVNGTCRYGSDDNAECVSMMLGSDGHANLAALLASISPGTKGGLDFLFAAGGEHPRDDGSGYTWGDINPINNGATLGLMGGVEPNPVSKCVPMSNLPLPTGITIPVELTQNTVSNWPAATPGPHIGIGVAERFFNYALSGMYNSGLLCLGLSTETIDLLNSGTLGLLAQSLRDLGLQRETQPVAIVLKPQTPPQVTFGNGTNLETDPLIDLRMDKTSFDFYMFSTDRYVRFMTATFDIRAPINLTVTPEGLVPVLDKLSIENGEVTNSELLKEDPSTLAASLQGLLAGQVGALLGSGLPAVDINGALSGLGLRLVIPETVEGQGSPGLRKITTPGGDNFLGIFGSLEVAAQQQALYGNVTTNAEIESIDLHKEQMQHLDSPSTPTRWHANPEVLVRAETTDTRGHALETQVRVDNGVWKPWSRDRFVKVRGPELSLEGHHKLEVRSRIVDKPYSVDREPLELEFVVDTMPPDARMSAVDESGSAKIDVVDAVSDEDAKVRYRFDSGQFSEWMDAEDLAVAVPADAQEIEIEAKDQSGNVSTAKQPIIRGLPRDAGGGCGCAVPGEASQTPNAKWPLSLLALGVVAMGARRRRRASSKKAEPVKPTAKAKASAAASPTSKVKTRALEAVAGLVVMGVGSTFSGCSCDETDTNTNPPYSCDEPSCLTLEPGLIGSYTSAAVDSKGTLWVAGYLEADYDSAFPSYGDLVVGKYDPSTDSVEWEIIDGVPTDPPPDPKATNVEGFRGGQTAPGDDVGLWTSIAIDPNSDMPAVAYYDRTHKGLKYALYDGTKWTITTVDDAGDSDTGRYAKLMFDGGTAKIAYQAISSSAGGPLTSAVRLASGGTSGFSTTDIVTNAATPCRFGFCTGGSVCVDTTGVCAMPGTTCGDCGTDACVNLDGTDQCATTLTTAKVEAYPLATGLYISMAKIPGGGLGVAYYDRVAGTLNIAAEDANGWVTAVVDGGVLPDTSVSDVGIGTSLAIDANSTWHLAYVDGYAEAMKYASVANGAVTGIEVVDDGLSVGGTTHPDGQHLVGDDTSVFITPQGEVHISYQDSTNGRLRFAVGVPQQTGHQWDLSVIEQDAFAGYFSRQIELDGSVRIVNWWRKLADVEGVKKGVGNVSVVTP
ncbi:MAG: MYXO-CTERM sorting domain-containing protein [Polyangiaceae bacterium]